MAGLLFWMHWTTKLYIEAEELIMGWMQECVLAGRGEGKGVGT